MAQQRPPIPALALGEERKVCSIVIAGPRSLAVTLGRATAARAASSTTISDLCRMPAEGGEGRGGCVGAGTQADTGQTNTRQEASLAAVHSESDL